MSKHESVNDDDDNVCIYTISDKSKSQLQAKLTITGTKKALMTQIDTGAGANLLPVRCFKQLYPQALSSEGKVDMTNPILTPKPLTSLTTYNRDEIKHFGIVDVKCDVGKHAAHMIRFYVRESDGPAI